MDLRKWKGGFTYPRSVEQGLMNWNKNFSLLCQEKIPDSFRLWEIDQNGFQAQTLRIDVELDHY